MAPRFVPSTRFPQSFFPFIPHYPHFLPARRARMRREIPGAAAGHRSIRCSASPLICAPLRLLVQLLPVSGSVSGFWLFRDAGPVSGEFECVLSRGFGPPGRRLPLGPALPCGSCEWTGWRGGAGCTGPGVRGRLGQRAGEEWRLPCSSGEASHLQSVLWSQTCWVRDHFLGLRSGALGECVGRGGRPRVRSEG